MASSPVTAPTPDSQPPPAPHKSPPAPPKSPSPKSSKSPPPISSSSPPPEKTPSSPPPTTTPASPPPEESAASPSGSSSPSPPWPPSADGSPSVPPPASSSPSPPSPPSSSALSPPPPPHSTRSHTPPPPSHSRSTTTPAMVSVNLPLVVGVTLGVGLLLVIMIFVLCCCTKRKKRPPNSMHYYPGAPGDGPHGPKGGDYYNNGQHPNWQQPMDHVMKIPPPAGGMWGPLPHPMAMNSTNYSTNYSGPHHAPLPPPSPNIALGFNKGTFTYDELALATGGFSEGNLLGQGGFGYVHKGVLPTGKEVAVKQLKSGSGQGEREFQAEVDIISRVHHRHLVSLVGYCIAGDKRMLVYEFVPNNTLEYHLHGEGLPTMDWPTRLKIALGSAKGLAYLHEDCHPRIIHRDIKAANILLDCNFEAMVADFGLAKLSSDTNTHVSTRVMGTFGYLAPEYAASGKLTEKSDVFSFGIMLLELITGRRPVDSNHSYMDDSLVDWAKPLLTHALVNKNYNELVDPRLENNYNPNEMARLVACAAVSVRHSARRRPKMSQIVRALEGDVSLEDLNEGMRPGESTIFSSSGSGSTDYDSSSHNGDMRRLRSMAVASREFGSNELNGPIDEYGLNPSDSSSESNNSREMKSVGNQRRSP